MILGELLGGDIDRNPRFRCETRVPVPDGQLANGGFEDPGADGHDHPVGLGDGDELVRQDLAEFWVCPADQGFEANGSEGREVDDRLIFEAQLVSAEYAGSSAEMFRRRVARERASASKTAIRSPPARLASRMAASASASASIDSAVSVAALVVTPTLKNRAPEDPAHLVRPSDVTRSQIELEAAEACCSLSIDAADRRVIEQVRGDLLDPPDPAICIDDSKLDSDVITDLRYRCEGDDDARSVGKGHAGRLGLCGC